MEINCFHRKKNYCCFSKKKKESYILLVPFFSFSKTSYFWLKKKKAEQLKLNTEKERRIEAQTFKCRNSICCWTNVCCLWSPFSIVGCVLIIPLLCILIHDYSLGIAQCCNPSSHKIINVTIYLDGRKKQAVMRSDGLRFKYVNAAIKQILKTRENPTRAPTEIQNQ